MPPGIARHQRGLEAHRLPALQGILVDRLGAIDPIRNRLALGHRLVERHQVGVVEQQARVDGLTLRQRLEHHRLVPLQVAPERGQPGRDYLLPLRSLPPFLRQIVLARHLPRLQLARAGVGEWARQ